MATIKKENLTPVLRNYIELKEREEKKKAESEKTPLMKYMEKAKESGTLLSSADMHEGEDVKMYAQRVKDERLKQEMERRVRDLRYKNAKTDITYDRAAETVKNMAFARNMPQPTAADRLRNRDGVKYTAPQTEVDYVPFVPENVRQRLAAGVGEIDLAREKQEEAGKVAEKARIAAARPVEQVYSDLDKLKERRDAFERTEAANDIADAINDLNMQEQKELLEANRITNRTQDEIDSIRADIRKKYETLRKDLENSGDYEGLNRDKRLLERELRDSYGKIKNNADFAELSQYKSTVEGAKDRVYEYVNKNPQVLEDEVKKLTTGDTAAVFAQGSDMRYYGFMSDEEVATYNYIYAKEGKKEAEKYLDHIESDLYARQRADSEERFSDFAMNHKVLASTASVVMNATKGTAYFGQALDRLINGEADPNAPYNKPVYISNAIRNTVSRQVEKTWGPVASFGYQTAMSMADFLTAAGMSGGTGLSLFIMGSGAAADTTMTALERGVDSDSALALGAIAGFAEALTEKLSVDALLKGDWTKKTLGYIAKNMFAEGSEEAASTFINTLADILISKDKSEWQISVQAYMDEGYSEKEAFRHTLFDNMKELGLDALGGAVSGALMGGGRAAIGKMGEAAAEADERYRQLETVRRAVSQETAKRADEIRARKEIPNVVLPSAGETINLPKAGDDTTSDSGKIVSGMEEPQPHLMTYSEKRLEDRIRNAKTTAEHSGLRLGVNEKDIRVAKTLSERIGRDIVFYSDTSADGKKVNGYFDPDTNTIYINKDRSAKSTVSFVLGHELTHTLEGTGAYWELTQKVFRQLTRDGVNIPKKLEETMEVRERAGKPLKSYEEAGAELTADYVGEKLLGSRSAIMELARENPSLARRLKNGIDRFMMKIAGTEDYVAFDFIAKAQKFLEEAEREAHEAEKAEAEAQEETKLLTEKTEPAPDVNTGTASEVSANSATDMNVGRKEEPKNEIEANPMQSDTPASGRTIPETKETEARETVTEEKDSSETPENAPDKPLPIGWAEYREVIEARHEAGEMTDEEYDEAISYVEEAIDTGVPFDRTSVKVEDIEGKIPAFVRKVGETLAGKTKADERQYSVSDYSEEDFSYKTLVSKPDMKITQMSIPDTFNGETPPSRKTVIQAALNNARTQNNPRNTDSNVFVRNKDTGIDILINNSSISHGLNRRYENNAIASANIASLLENAVLVNRHTARDGINEGGVYISAGRYGDELFVCRIITNESNVMQEIETMYALNAKKESVAHYRLDSTEKPLLDTDSKISISDLLDIVKKFFADVLPSDVLVRMGKERPASTVSDSAKYSVSDAGENSGDKSTLFNTLPTQAMTKLKKAEETFAANLREMFTLNSDKGEPVNIDPSDIRAISSGYILYGAETSHALNQLFEKYNTAKSPGNNAYQYGQFGRLADQYENTLKAVKRFADSKKQLSTPKEKTERKHYTTEEAAKLFEAQREARRELDRVKARAILTEEDKIAMGKVRRGEMSLGQLNPSEYNVDDIQAVLRAQTAFDEADKQIKVYRSEIKAGYMGEAEAALADIADWKDKEPLAYWRETIDRNFQDIIPDKEKAEAFIRQYIKPVGKAEANRQKMIEDYRERVKALKLKEKPADGEKVSESYAVQFLGEAEDNIRILEKMRDPNAVRDGKTLDEWKSAVASMWAENPSLDEAKIREGVKEFHKIYNELLDKMNEVLLRNGYAPVRYRSGYFPHFTIGSEDAVLAKFSRLFGINLEVNPLPTSINGLTQDFKPGKTWFSHALERTGFETVYDAVAGFEQYIGGVSDVIWHTDNIQRFRALTSQIRWLSADEGLRQQVQKIENDEDLSEEQKQSLKSELFEKGRYRMSNLAVYLDEYTNRLANKKNRIDRGMEQLIGRKAYTVMNNLESRVAANMIGLNIGSALTNIIPLNQAQAVIGPMYTVRGMWDALQNLKNGDGLAAQSDFLVRRRGSERLGLTRVEKFSNVAGMPMELVDNIVSEAIVRAAYLKNLESGMSEDAALEDADAVAASLMADRSKGALPLIFDVKNPLAKLLTQFQVEVNNEFSVIFKDIPKAFKEKGLAKLAAVLLQYFLGAKIFNDLYEKALGRRPAFDPLEMVNDAVGGLTGYQLPNVLDIFEPEAWNPGRENPADVITDFGTAAVESLPFVGGLFGGGRVPIQSAFPDVKRLINAAANNEWSGRKKTAVALEELANPLFYLAPPTMGGAIKKVINTAVAVAKGGVYGIADKKVDGIPVGREELKYPLYMDTPGEAAANIFRSLASGTTTTPGGIEWVEGEFQSLSPKQTAAYEMLREYGVDAHDSWDLIKSLREAEADIKDPKNEKDDVSQAAVQREILRNSNVPDEAKAAVYTALYVTETKELELLESVSESGFTDTVIALMDMKDIPSKASETAEKLRIIANTNLSYSDARKLYDLKVAGDSFASHDRIISNMNKAGVAFDDYLRARAEYTEINNNGEMDILEKTIAFDNWLYKNIRNPVHVSALKENLQFKISMSVPASEVTSVKNYSIMTENGMSEETAHEVASAVSALKPLEGKSTVSAAQKARAVLDTVSDDEERASALAAVLKDDYRKYGIAHDLGVGFDVYTSFRETLPSYDADGNSSYSQAEIVNAIESLTGAISPEEMIALLMSGQPIPSGTALTDAQKAVIWQLATGSKSAKNNPYSTSAGNKVIEMLGRAE